MSTDPIGMSGIEAQMQAAVQQAATDRAPRADDNPVEAARKFEAYLAQVMLKEMRKTVPDGGIFGKAPMNTFVDMFDQAVAERIAEGGRLGLAQQLARAIGADDVELPGVSSHSPAPGRLLALHPHSAVSESHAHGAPAERLGYWPVDGAISSHFGRRADPFHGKARHHAGLDIAAAEGSPIRAVEGGEVILSGKRGSYGNVVMIRHNDGTTGLYAHCKSVGVPVGTKVRAGQPIATVGQTGRATGPHLHFELRGVDGAIDPEAAYRFQGR